MIEFAVAAEAAEVDEDEDIVEVEIDGVKYTARRPTTAQSALLAVALTQTGTERLSAIFNIAEALLGTEGREHIERLVWARRIDLDDLIGGNEKHAEGLLDSIFSEFSERPTQPSADSASSQPVGGRKSTGRSPGKGSIHSASH